MSCKSCALSSILSLAKILVWHRVMVYLEKHPTCGSKYGPAGYLMLLLVSHTHAFYFLIQIPIFVGKDPTEGWEWEVVDSAVDLCKCLNCKVCSSDTGFGWEMQSVIWCLSIM